MLEYIRSARLTKSVKDADFPDAIIQDEVGLCSDVNLGVIHTTVNNLSPTISSISSWIHQVELGWNLFFFFFLGGIFSLSLVPNLR